MSSGFFGLDNVLESSAFTCKEMTREADLGEKIICLHIVLKGEIYRLSSRQLESKSVIFCMKFLGIHCGICHIHTVYMCIYLSITSKFLVSLCLNQLERNTYLTGLNVRFE